MISTSKIKTTEYTLLKYLGMSLRHPEDASIDTSLTEDELHAILLLAERHEVLPLLDKLWAKSPLTEPQRQLIQHKTAATVHKSIKLQTLNARITEILHKENITAVTLKGCAVARFYPVAEFRKTTDIDLFVKNEEQAERAARIMCKNGFRRSGQWHANHHLVLISEQNEVVELHTAWAEAFQEKRLNKCLAKLQKESIHHCRLIEWQGINIYAYETAWQGLYLIIHMLQHFVASGFGLRNLCDWVVLWENCDDAKARKDFWNMACESGTSEFVKAVNAVCVNYLGLSCDKSPIPPDNAVEQDIVDALLRDVLDAGEFGYSEAERMVGMDGSSWTAYVREFHHQMHINFPKSGRIIFLWPVLWVVTLVRFLKNNKKLNRAPISAIMKKAGERGRLVSRLTAQK